MRSINLLKTLVLATPLALLAGPISAKDIGPATAGATQAYADRGTADDQCRHRSRMSNRALRARISARGYHSPKSFVFVNGGYRVYARDRRNVEVILIVDAYTGAILDVQYVRARYDRYDHDYMPWGTISIRLGDAGYSGYRNYGFHDGYYRVRAYDRRHRPVWFRVHGRTGAISGVSFTARW